MNLLSFYQYQSSLPARGGSVFGPKFGKWGLEKKWVYEGIKEFFFLIGIHSMQP